MVVDVVYGDIKASILKAHLESEGIPVLLKYESLGRVYPLIIDGLGAIKIQVPAEFAEEAKKILQQSADTHESDSE